MRASYLIGILALSWSAAYAGPVPFVVRQMAEQYLASQPTSSTNLSSEKKRPDLLDALRPPPSPFFPPVLSPADQFASDFFAGFTGPNSIRSSDNSIRDVAFAKGQTYWREHPNERVQIFAGYGYARVEITGIWYIGFERSDFLPNGSTSNRWWLERLEESTSNISLTSELFKYRVQIVGFLSPEGYFGHRGLYARQLLATSVMLADQ